MNTFKVNDWVLDDEDNLFQVTRVRDDKIALVDEPFYVPAKEFRLWKPQVGEWCWFYSECTFPTIGRYLGSTPDGLHYMKEYPLDLWEKVEPFIGKVPSWIKEKQDEQ